MTDAEAAGELAATELDARGAEATLATGVTTRVTLAIGDTAGATTTEALEAGLCEGKTTAGAEAGITAASADDATESAALAALAGSTASDGKT